MNANENEQRATLPNLPTLHSWKEIAAYLQRNEVTARRWEKEEGLPVHRHSHKLRASVYAYPAEIDAWRASRRLPVETTVAVETNATLPVPPFPAERFGMRAAFGAAMALCLVMAGGGLLPGVAAAQSPTARQIWLTQDIEQDVSESIPSADGPAADEYGRLGTFR